MSGTNFLGSQDYYEFDLLSIYKGLGIPVSLQTNKITLREFYYQRKPVWCLWGKTTEQGGGTVVIQLPTNFDRQSRTVIANGIAYKLASMGETVFWMSEDILFSSLEADLLANKGA